MSLDLNEKKERFDYGKLDDDLPAMGLPETDDASGYSLSAMLPGDDAVLSSVHEAVDEAHIDPEVAAMLEAERHALITHCQNIGKADQDLLRVHHMLVEAEKARRVQKIKDQIRLYKPKRVGKKPPKKGKKVGQKTVVMADKPKHEYDTAPGVLELDVDGIEPEPEKFKVSKKKTNTQAKLKRNSQQDRSDLCRIGAPTMYLFDEEVKIAEDRAAAALIRKELDKLDVEREPEVEVVPWVPSTFAEKQRVQKEKAMTRLEVNLIRERADTINQIRYLLKRRRYAWLIALKANLTVLGWTGMVGLFSSNPTRVLPWLFFGGPDIAKDREKLEQMGVTHIINATRSVKNHFHGEFMYFRVKIDEGEGVPAETLITAFTSVAELLDAVEVKGGAALVHCSSGLSRAPCIIIAYLILKQARTLRDAYNYCAAMKPELDINTKFLYVLARLEYTERSFTSVATHPTWRFSDYVAWKRANNPKRGWGRGFYRTYARFWLGPGFGGNKVAPARR